MLTRTAKASEVLLHRAGAGAEAARFHVVSNGRDARKFHPFDAPSRSRVRAGLGIADDAPLLVYAGSIGPQYCLEGIVELFANVWRRRPEARMLVLSSSATPFMEMANRLSIPADAIVQTAIRPGAVPEYLACADLGLALRTPSFSMQAVAPIKLGEYLLCGLPVVATRAIGNTSVIDGDTGCLLDSIDPRSLERAAAWFVETVLPDREGFRERSQRLGQAHFSLEDSVRVYLRALDLLRNS